MRCLVAGSGNKEMMTVSTSIVRALILAVVALSGWMPVNTPAAETDVTPESEISLVSGFQYPPKLARPSV